MSGKNFPQLRIICEIDPGLIPIAVNQKFQTKRQHKKSLKNCKFVLDEDELDKKLVAMIRQHYSEKQLWQLNFK